MEGRDDTRERDGVSRDVTDRLMRHEVQFGEVMKALGEETTATRMLTEQFKDFRAEFRTHLDRMMDHFRDEISVVHERIASSRKEAVEGDERIRKELEPLKTFKIQLITYWTAAVAVGGLIIWLINKIWT